jgi:osmoprotectant transport system substrate-binding protein
MDRFAGWRYLIAIALLLDILLPACSAGGTLTTQTPSPRQEGSQVAAGTGTVVIGSKDFTEEFIVAEIYAALLEHAGFKVVRKLNLGGTPVAQAAILRGDIDLYPEYTSTALLTVLKQKSIKDPQLIFDTVKSEYERQFQLTWLQPAPFNDTQALAMTRAGAQQHGIQTFSELAQKAPALVLGGPAEFLEREDGIKGLQSAYGGFQFKEVNQLGTGSLRYQALLDGQMDVVVAFSTDGQIAGENLVLLQDDKGFYPVYQVAPVVRMDTLERYPQIAGILNAVEPLLTGAVMSGLNWQVDGPEKKEPADIAQAFLKQSGLLK